MRAILYPLGRIVGSRQHKKFRYEVCTNVTETDTLSSTVACETFQINHKLNCDNNCPIYLLKCEVSKKYVSEKRDAFWLRWNNKDNNIKFKRNESCMQQYLYEHFYREGHNESSGNVCISLIHKTDGFQL